MIKANTTLLGLLLSTSSAALAGWFGISPVDIVQQSTLAVFNDDQNTVPPPIGKLGNDRLLVNPQDSRTVGFVLNNYPFCAPNTQKWEVFGAKDNQNIVQFTCRLTGTDTATKTLSIYKDRMVAAELRMGKSRATSILGFKKNPLLAEVEFAEARHIYNVDRGRLTVQFTMPENKESFAASGVWFDYFWKDRTHNRVQFIDPQELMEQLISIGKGNSFLFCGKEGCDSRAQFRLNLLYRTGWKR